MELLQNTATKLIRQGDFLTASHFFKLTIQAASCHQHPVRPMKLAQLKILHGLCSERLNMLGDAWSSYKQAFELFLTSHNVGCFNCYTCVVIFHLANRISTVLHKRGDITNALNIVTKIGILAAKTITDPKVMVHAWGVWAEVLELRATVLQDVREYDTAEELLLRVREIYLNYPFSVKDTARTETLLGDLYVKMGRSREALSLYTSATHHLIRCLPDSCPPNLPETLYKTARIIRGVGCTDAASKVASVGHMVEYDFVHGSTTFVKKLLDNLREVETALRRSAFLS